MHVFYSIDSLNRHSYLTLLGCVSPYKDDWGETLTTLRFVNETKKMKMTPQLNNLIIEYKVFVYCESVEYETLSSYI